MVQNRAPKQPSPTSVESTPDKPARRAPLRARRLSGQRGPAEQESTSVREDFFRAIAEIYVDDHYLTLQAARCPDQDVGPVRELAEAKEFRGAEVSERRDRRRVILILESPHLREFSVPGAPAPARGSTGANIRRYLSEVEGLGDVGGYNLILMNPVQYQCSLGASPIDARRVKIFTSTWNRSGAADFVRRLRSYYAAGDRVVNCCTVKANGNAVQGAMTLRRLVQEAILTVVPAALRRDVLCRTHPASWVSGNNRRAVDC
jgi:hypothetical protein